MNLSQDNRATLEALLAALGQGLPASTAYPILQQTLQAQQEQVAARQAQMQSYGQFISEGAASGMTAGQMGQTMDLMTPRQGVPPRVQELIDTAYPKPPMNHLGQIMDFPYMTQGAGTPSQMQFADMPPQVTNYPEEVGQYAGQAQQLLDFLPDFLAPDLEYGPGMTRTPYPDSQSGLYMDSIPTAQGMMESNMQAMAEEQMRIELLELQQEERDQPVLQNILGNIASLIAEGKTREKIIESLMQTIAMNPAWMAVWGRNATAINQALDMAPSAQDWMLTNQGESPPEGPAAPMNPDLIRAIVESQQELGY